jgi:hypothetical protein
VAHQEIRHRWNKSDLLQELVVSTTPLNSWKSPVSQGLLPHFAGRPRVLLD